MVHLDKRSIPKTVITGRNKRYIKVYNLYRALMIREYYRLVNKSMWVRGTRGTDPVAGKWKPLTKYTREIKNKLAEDGKLNTYKLLKNWYEGIVDETMSPYDRVFLKGRVSKTILSPEHAELFERQFKQTFEEELKNVDSKTAKKLAIRKAWERIRHTTMYTREGEIFIHDSKYEEDRVFANIINYRTGRLFASTFPGTVANNRYYPSSKDQIVKYTPKKIVISFEAVPHAAAVDRDRPLMPSNIDPWMEQAHNKIIHEVEQLYVSMRSDHERRLAAIKEERRKRRTFWNKPKRDRRATRGKTKGNKRSKGISDTPF